MQFKSTGASAHFDYSTGDTVIMFRVSHESRKCIDEILKIEGDISVEVKKYSPKRSRDANAYMWTLCGKMSEKLSNGTKVTKEDVYRKAIKEIGVYKQVEISENAANTLIYSWNLHGVGWLAEKVDYSKHEGFVIINLYYGSSTYNKKQMSRLIDNIVQDCHALGIETKTPDEIALMKAMWNDEKQTNKSAGNTVQC